MTNTRFLADSKNKMFVEITKDESIWQAKLSIQQI